MAAYYNELDPYAAQWLRNLIAAGHIAAGDVDERSIADVRADDLVGYAQCHFFAGIGVWSYALRLAGWPDDRPVWTGSCPCQPFSAAGKRGGVSDDRHLWPDFFRLIAAHRPVAVFGEQVASKDGLAWLDIVHADLEGAGYSVGAVDTCAAGFGAPHIRQRLYFVADLHGSRRGARRSGQAGDGGNPARVELAGLRAAHGVALGDTFCAGLEKQRRDGGLPRRQVESPPREGAERADTPTGSLGHATSGGWRQDGRDAVGDAETNGGRQASGDSWAGPTNGFWHPADWLPCIDGKARPVEPGTFPLAHGAPARVGRLRAYGNAINAHQAAEFIRAYREMT